MKLSRLGLVALCALWVGCADFGKAEAEFCERNPASCAGASVVLDPAVKATCVLLQIRDPASGVALETRWLPRSGNTLPLEIRQGTFPEKVELAARPFLDGSCAGGTPARTHNGPFVTVTALFVEGLAEATPLKLEPGVDVDGDTYVAEGSDGADCDDGLGAINPGAAEVCTDQVDLNCDFRKGCEASACGPQACVGPPAAVAVTLPSPLTAGTCVGGGTVTLKDAAGGNSRVGADTAVSLQVTPGGSISFYSDAACTTPVTSVTIPANSSSATFFFQGQLVGNATVTASATGLTQGTQAATVNPGAGNRLAFQGSAQTVTAGVCSPQAVQIQSRDAQGNPAPVTVATALALSATPNTGFKFYLDAGCTTEVTSVNIASQASTASFYFRGTKSGSVTVAVTAAGVTGTTQAQTINAAAPSVIVITPSPVTVQVGSCSAAISVTLQDAFGNPATATTSTQLNLIPSNAQLALFSNNTCTTAASTLTIAPGAGSRDFFVRATQASTYSVLATGSGLTNGTVSVTVTAGPPTVVVFTAPAQSPLQAGVCSAIATVQQRDANANPVSVTSPTTVNLSASAQGFEFFTNSTCTGTPVTTTSIATGSSTASFYFRGTKLVTNATLTASVNSLSATQSVTITAAPPSVLAFTLLPTTAAAGACSQVVLQTQDSFGNPSNVSGAQTVTLTPSPTDGFTFHTTTTNCTGAVATTQVTVPAGQNSVTFYARGTKTGSVNLLASAPGLTNGSGTITITATAVNKVVFATPQRAVTAGACSPIVTLQSTDTFGNPVAVTTAESVVLSATAGDATFAFYSDANCNTAITSVTIPATQSSASFYFKAERVRTVTVTANTATLAGVAQDQTIAGASATTLTFSASTPPATLLAGTCAVRTVEGLDAFGNPSTNALSVTLTGSTATEFFSDPNCTVPATQVSIAAGTGSVTFSFKGLAGGINASAPLTLTAASTPPLSATQTESILPTVRTGSCSIGSTGSNVTCTIAPALSNVARAFLTFQATNAATDPGGANVRCHLNSTSQVRCERGDNNGGTANIQWSMAEFPTGVNVQHQTPTCAGDVTDVSLSAVVPGSTFLLLSSRRDDTGQGNSVPRLAELKSSTLAEIRKTGGCVGTDSNALQAVEYAGASVQRSATTTMGSFVTSQEVLLSPAVDPTRSIVLFSFLSDGSGIAICNRALRGELTNNGGTVRFSRAEGTTANNCASSNVSAISWEVIQFPVGTFVQQVTQQLAASAASATITLPTPVDSSRTIVLMSGQGSSGQSGGEGRYAFGEILGEMRARAVLNAAGTTVTLTRDSANASATFTLYVVQLKP